MPTTIESVTIGSLEKRVVLDDSQVARQLSIGSNWTRLRVGCRCAVDDSGGNLFGMSFYLGLMSAPTSDLSNGPLGAAGHFIGVLTLNTQWTRNAGPPVSYGPNANNFAATKVNGTVVTGGGGSSVLRICAAPSTHRKVWIVEITKGSPNFTVRVVAWAGTTGIDNTFDHLKTAIGLDPLSSAQAYLQTTVSSGTHLVWPVAGAVSLAVNEATNGSLVAICAAWNRAQDIKMHISELLWKKMA